MTLLYELNVPIRIRSPNVRSHWAKDYKQKQYQHLVLKSHWNRILSISPGTLKNLLPLHCVLIKHGRKMDDDNLASAFKSIRDFIASKIMDDNIPGHADGDARLSWEYKQTKRLELGKDSITIQIWKKRYGEGKIPC